MPKTVLGKTRTLADTKKAAARLRLLPGAAGYGDPLGRAPYVGDPLSRRDQEDLPSRSGQGHAGHGGLLFEAVLNRWGSGSRVDRVDEHGDLGPERLAGPGQRGDLARSGQGQHGDQGDVRGGEGS